MKKLIIALLLLSAIYSCRKKHWNCDEQVSFKNDIQPMLSKHCVKCHATYDTYIMAQSLAQSGSLKESVINTSRMPKDGSLTKTERKKIYCWIEQGALDN